MQIKIYTIPVFGGEMLTEEMNIFLRSKKILQVENQLINIGQNTAWCFCIKYLDDMATAERERQKVDYRKLLDEATFEKFRALREIRKRVAEAESVPAYVIFTDEELAGLAKLEKITPTTMQTVKGIGEKKIEKYGSHFSAQPQDEKGKKPD